MKEFIRQYENPNVSRFNMGLINKEYDESLLTHIVDCCESLEVLKYITFIGYDYITDESDINTSEYIEAKTRIKKTKKETPLKYMHLKDSRFAEVRLKFKLECKGEVEYITKKLLIPVPDDQGRYWINGTPYFLMYQVVDNSTYTTRNSLILKSMMPVALKREFKELTSTDGVEYSAPIYTINIFRKDTDIMLFYLARMGLDKTLKYFSVDMIMKFTSSIGDTDENVYFSISSKLFLEINKHFFEEYSYVKTIAFMLLIRMTNRMTMENLNNKEYWIEVIGSIGNTNMNTRLEKGLNTLTFVDRIIDASTKKIVKVHKINSDDIYSSLRWMISNFDELRKKDNLNLDNKRLRCNEYIASLLTKAFSERVNRIIAMGNKVSIGNIREIFSFQGDTLILQLHRSGLLKFDDRVKVGS